MTRQHDQFKQESLYFLLLIKTVFLSFLCGMCVVQLVTCPCAQFVPVNRRKWCQKKKYALKFEFISCMTFPFSDICLTGTTFAREHLRPFECPLCKDHQNSVVLIQHNICSLFSFRIITDSLSYLLGVGQVEFGCQVDRLQLHYVLLGCKSLGHLAEDIRCDLWHPLAVLSHQPQDAGSGHRDLTSHRTIKVVIVLFYNTSSRLNFHVGQLQIKSKEENRTVMLSKSLAMCLMISLCCVG